MNDTPRTEEAIGLPSNWNDELKSLYLRAFPKHKKVDSDFARTLERELAEARKDTARLDWVMANIEAIGPAPTDANPHPKHKWLFTAPLYDNVRSAIDAALR